MLYRKYRALESTATHARSAQTFTDSHSADNKYGSEAAAADDDDNDNDDSRMIMASTMIERMATKQEEAMTKAL